MTTTLLSATLVLLAFIAPGWGLRLARARARRRAVLAAPDETTLLHAAGVPARIFVQRSLLTGPQAGRTNQALADLRLSPERLLVATHHGLTLEVRRGDEAAVRCTGPRRLVIEGERALRDGPMKVRVELIVDEAERWSGACAERLGTRAGLSMT